MKKTAVISLIILSLAQSGQWGCGKKENAPQEKQEPVFNVRVWKAVKEEVVETVSAVGTLAPEEEVTVSSEVSAPVTRIFKYEGSMVEKGEPLLSLDEEKFRLIVSRNEAELVKAASDLQFAEEDFRRKEALFKEGVISKEGYDAAKRILDSSRGQSESVNAELLLAKKDLKNSKVLAPFSGFLSERYVAPGSYVGAGEKLFKLIDIDPLKISARIPENYSSRIKKGQVVALKISSVDGDFRGAIYFISPDIDEKNRSFEIKARIPNPGAALKPGLFSEVTITTGVRKGVFVVSENAVVTRDDKRVVFVVTDGHVAERAVVTGEREAGKVVVTGGIKEGESIVIDGAQNLKDGSKVTAVTS